MKKISIFILFVVVLFFFQAPIVAEQMTKTDEKKQKITQEAVENNPWETKYAYSAQNSDKIFWQLAILDFLIPGYGMYASGKYYWGSGYALGKLIGALFIYFSVDRYLFWRPFANEVSNQTSFSVPTQFDVPGVGQQTARQILTNADVSLILVMFSVTFEIIVSGVSILHTLSDHKNQYKQGAYYKIDFEVDEETKLNRADVKLGYQFIF